MNRTKPLVQLTTTSQGIRVLTERMENVRSVSVGLWFETGSRDETPEMAGISHFLEHMFFKGTKKRTALQIAQEIEQVGGYTNAFTSKEVTAFYAHLLDEHLDLAVDSLTDILSNSTFASDLIEKERTVVLEEIASYEDQPDDVIHEDFSHLIFADHNLGCPVLGTRETVSSFTQEDCIKRWSSYYVPERALVVAAGAVDHDKLVKMVEEKLKLANDNGGRPQRTAPALAPELSFTRKKDIVQSHMCMGVRGLSYGDSRRYPFFVLNTILGGGMSARLFQRLREEHGLCYSVYTFSESHTDSGLYGVYTALEEKNVAKAEDMIRHELQRLIDEPLSAEELLRCKAQVKGGTTLGLENVSARMNRLARMQLYLNRYVSIDDLLDGISRVTAEEVQSIAQDLFTQDLYSCKLLPSNKA